MLTVVHGVSVKDSIAEAQGGYPATRTEMRCPEQNFQKLEQRSIVTMAKREKQEPREAPGFSEDESKASRNNGGFRSGYLGGQFRISSKAGNPTGYWSQSGSTRFRTLGIKFALQIFSPTTFQPHD